MTVHSLVWHVLVKGFVCSSDTDIQPCDATGKDKGCVAIGLDLPHSSKNYSMQDVLAVSQPSGNEDARNDRTEKVNGVIQQNRT